MIAQEEPDRIAKLPGKVTSSRWCRNVGLIGTIVAQLSMTASARQFAIAGALLVSHTLLWAIQRDMARRQSIERPTRAAPSRCAATGPALASGLKKMPSPVPMNCAHGGGNVDLTES